MVHSPLPHVRIRAGYPDFLDLPWERSVGEWTGGRVVDAPTGLHRHPIRFVAYGPRLFAVKELPLRLARHEYETLLRLGHRLQTVARVVGHVERPWLDPHEEASGAVVTEWVPYSFTYRELIQGGGFGEHRGRMVSAFATLLVELHLAGCFWGDGSLSNVLYRWDAQGIDAVMIDAETSRLEERLTDGQRTEDIELMTVNVAGGMADIAASRGVALSGADLALGEDIAARYHGLWDEVTGEVVGVAGEAGPITARKGRLEQLGFHVDDIELVPGAEGQVRARVTVGGRTFHATRLWETVRVDAGEDQASEILGSLDSFLAEHPELSGEAAAMQWRVDVFEPLVTRIGYEEPDFDPIQMFCDFLQYHRGSPLEHNEAFEAWLAQGRPGYPPPE